VENGRLKAHTPQVAHGADMPKDTARKAVPVHEDLERALLQLPFRRRRDLRVALTILTSVHAEILVHSS
jgi:hypothetical protein